MPETESKKIVVSPEVYAKVKEWADAGRTVYRFICPHLGCLCEYYSPNVGTGCPRHAWRCGGTPEREIKPDDLQPEQRILEPLKFRDLVFYWRESNQMSIVMEVPGHWRPVKVESFGYLFGMDRETYREIKRENGTKAPTKWVREALASGRLEEILNHLGYTLGERRPG